MNKSTIQQLLDAVVQFRRERDWDEMANLKDTAIAASLETAELLDHFKWKTNEEIETYVPKHRNEIEEEMMDVIFNILLMVSRLQTNVDTAFFEKMEKNKKKYPIEEVKGKNPHV